MEYVLIVFLLIYLVPSMLADVIGHPQRGWILALNLALGWTGIGWLAAAVWAYQGRPREAARPKLVLITPGQEAHEPTPLVPTLRRHVAHLTVGMACAVSAALYLDATAQGPGAQGASFFAVLEQRSVALRAGPGEAWSAIGEIDSPCRATIIDQRGDWQYIRRDEGCDGTSSKRTGWVRREGWRRVVATAKDR